VIVYKNDIQHETVKHPVQVMKESDKRWRNISTVVN